MKELSAVAKGAGVGIIGFFVSKVISYFYTIFLARTLGPEQLGILAIATGLLGFMIMFANLGLPYGIMRYIAFYKSKGDDARVKGTIHTGLAINLLMSAVFGSLLFFSADFFAGTVYGIPELADVLRVFSLIVPLGTIVTTFLLSIQGFQRVEYKIFVRTVVENISKLFFYGIFFVLGLRLMGATFALLLSYLVSVLVSFYLLEKKVYPFVRTKLKPKYNFSELLDFSWPLLLGGIFTALLITVDVFMIGYFVGAEGVGIYNTAETLARLVSIGYESISLLFLPIATGYFALNKKKEMQKFFKIITRWTVSLGLPAFVFLIIFSYPLITAFYGEAYSPGYISLVILCIGFFVVGGVGPTQDLLRAIGKPRYDLINTIIATIADIVLNWFLIPIYGIAGAAISTAFSYALWNILSLVEIYIFLRIHPYSWSFLKPITAAAITGLVTFFVSGYIVVDSLPLLFIAAFLVGLFYFAVFVLIKGFEPEDLELFMLSMKRFGLDKNPLVVRFAKMLVR